MRKLTIGLIDILGKSTARKAYSRYSRTHNQSVMAQAVAVWCEELGHDVSMVYYDGPACMIGEVPEDADIVFISSFSQSALLAYALSQFFRGKGAVTVLGGPHARAYPEDAVQYFDYVVGLCNKDLVHDILQDCSPYRPRGVSLSATEQPSSLPGVVQRWKFIESTLEQAPLFKMIPIIGSLGCPYTCSFCIDASVPYQALDFDALRDDLRFLRSKKLPRTLVAWHDPNFGVRFDDYLEVIEEAVPPGSLTFAAEMSLSLLKESHCRRLRKNGFKVVLPGIESWYDVGGKSKVNAITGREKMRRVAEHVNMVLSYIPYLQANIIFGLDADEGAEPFDLTREFVDRAPGAFPYFSLLTSYGRSAPANLEYQREGRVLNVPFHFLNHVHAINVRPRHYAWPEFFDHICQVYDCAFSRRALFIRFKANRDAPTRFEQFFRGWASERNHKLIRNHRKMRDRLRADGALCRYFDGETTQLPEIFIEPIQRDLEWLWPWLPDGAIYHDPNAYLHATAEDSPAELKVQAGKVRA